MIVKLDITRNDLKKVSDKMREACMGGVSDGAEWVLGEAGKITPHDEGILEGSGHVVDDKRTLTSTIGYDTPYARRMHENPHYNFQGKGQGKWLENTMKREADIARVMRKGIEKRM